MTTEELIELVEQIRNLRAEAQTTEVKAAHSGYPKRLYDTLSSFSNQNTGGTIVFGLDERQQFKVVGVYDLQDLMKHVTEQCSQMEPPVRAVFTMTQYQGKAVCAAEIPAAPLSERPCYYMGAGRVRGSYIRVGDADLPMTDYEVYSFEAYRRHLHDDVRSVPGASMEFINQDLLEEYIREKKKERPQFAGFKRTQMYEMLNVTRGGEITLAAWMCFGMFPQSMFPQLGVTAVVVQGYEIGDVAWDGARFIDNKRINGTIAEQVEETIAFCRRNMKTRTIIDSATGKRRDKTEYPVNAIREAVLNAVIHRDYSVHTEGTPIQVNFFANRLEIHSPGNLYGRLTVEDLGMVRGDIRNPTLALMAESMTEAENRYSGIPTIRREMAENGLPEPVFENRRNEFVVTLYNGENASLENGSYGAWASGVVGMINENIPYLSAENTQNKSGYNNIYIAKDRVAEMLLDFCRQPRSREEITRFLGVGTQFYVIAKYVKPLLESGRLKMTLPEKPKSKNQRYYTV